MRPDLLRPGLRAAVADELELDETVVRLLMFSLLTRQGDNVSIHRLLQAFVATASTRPSIRRGAADRPRPGGAQPLRNSRSRIDLDGVPGGVEPELRPAKLRRHRRFPYSRSHRKVVVASSSGSTVARARSNPVIAAG